MKKITNTESFNCAQPKWRECSPVITEDSRKAARDSARAMNTAQG
jgi:hypothetical protein